MKKFTNKNQFFFLFNILTYIQHTAYNTTLLVKKKTGVKLLIYRSYKSHNQTRHLTHNQQKRKKKQEKKSSSMAISLVNHIFPLFLYINQQNSSVASSNR